MTNEEFDEFLDGILSEIESTLSSKAEQYSANDDRFHNFYRAATFDEKRPVDSLRGMQTKHRVAIADFLDRENIIDTSYSEWKEKIVDNINYYILMLAMISKEHKNYFFEHYYHQLHI